MSEPKLAGAHTGALRADVDALLRRHEEDVRCCLDRWLACQAQPHGLGVPACLQASPLSDATLVLSGAAEGSCCPALPSGPEGLGDDALRDLGAGRLVAERATHGSAWQEELDASGDDTEATDTLAEARGFSVEKLSCVDLCEDTPPGNTSGSSRSKLIANHGAEALPGQPQGIPRLEIVRRAGSSSCVSAATSKSVAGRSQGSRSQVLAAASRASTADNRSLAGPLPPRFPAGLGRPEKTPQHKRWESNRRVGRTWRSPTRSFTPLAKRTAAALVAKQSDLERCTRSPIYEFIEAMAVIANAVFVIFDTQHRAELLAAGPGSLSARRGDAGFNVLADLFSVFFTVSLLLHAMSEKWQFFTSRDRFWNVCDIVIVFTANLESLARWHQYVTENMSDFRAFAGKFSMLRIVRLLRIVRGTRSIRVSRFIREFCIMVFSLTSAIKPLCWSVVLMGVVLLVFGVFLADGAIAFVVRGTDDGATPWRREEDLTRYFNTLSSTVLTLYMAMSGGLDWIDVWQALQSLPPEYGLAFLAFIAFSILAMLNVITAVFVETVMQRSQKDRELLVQQEMERKVDFSESMLRVFEELDTNQSGTLTLEEFEMQLQDENVLTFLSTLELDINQVRTLLTLLDRDQNGEVDIEEFITGCLRLKGGAKSLDMAILQYQVEWLLYNMACIGEVLLKERSESP